jgi:hypothetical protein
VQSINHILQFRKAQDNERNGNKQNDRNNDFPHAGIIPDFHKQPPPAGPKSCGRRFDI